MRVAFENITNYLLKMNWRYLIGSGSSFIRFKVKYRSCYRSREKLPSYEIAPRSQALQISATSTEDEL